MCKFFQGSLFIYVMPCYTYVEVNLIIALKNDKTFWNNILFITLHYIYTKFLACINKIFIHFLSFAVLADGLPVVNTTCDVIFPGRTGKSKGYISSPNIPSIDVSSKGSKKPLPSILKHHEGPLTCTSSFVPTDAQSITMTVKTNLFLASVLYILTITVTPFRFKTLISLHIF